MLLFSFIVFSFFIIIFIFLIIFLLFYLRIILKKVKKRITFNFFFNNSFSSSFFIFLSFLCNFNSSIFSLFPLYISALSIHRFILTIHFYSFSKQSVRKKLIFIKLEYNLKAQNINWDILDFF
jgi:hypothetical protein